MRKKKDSANLGKTEIVEQMAAVQGATGKRLDYKTLTE